jgi:2,4-dienoyl-CoA reductase-like NADH-dependent reductase (Old Yellow Enzyme family)
MENPSQLFSPILLGPIKLANRIMVSPMCQYSAQDGNATDWHTVHLGSLAVSGAGLLCVEATAIKPEGRITYGCLGLYNDANEAALQRVVKAVRTASSIPLAIQLSHAGRKASSRVPWEGGALIGETEGGWHPLAPSPVPFKPEEAAPKEMGRSDIAHVVAGFVETSRRARRLGFDVVEIHMAHGYLVHQFLSPLSNRRGDEYGGSLENRMRLPLEVFRAVAEAAGPDIAVGVRVSATDWAEGGWDVAQTIALCKRLELIGCSFIDVSSGGLFHLQKILAGPGYQVPFSEAIKKEVRVPVVAVGMITQPQQAEDIVAAGKADVVAIARGFLNDPRWPWRAAVELTGTVTAPRQFWRCLPHGSAPIFGEVRIGQR